jgi:hypothetical protein
LQLIYLGYALTYDAQAKEVDGWELASTFQPITSSAVSTLRLSDRHFLTAARRIHEASRHSP